jgi:hypothetical protein
MQIFSAKHILAVINHGAWGIGHGALVEQGSEKRRLAEHIEN